MSDPIDPLLDLRKESLLDLPEDFDEHVARGMAARGDPTLSREQEELAFFRCRQHPDHPQLAIYEMRVVSPIAPDELSDLRGRKAVEALVSFSNGVTQGIARSRVICAAETPVG